MPTNIHSLEMKSRHSTYFSTQYVLQGDFCLNLLKCVGQKFIDEFNSFEESMISRRLQLLIRAESALNYRFLPRRTASLIDDNYGQILTNELEFIFSKTHEKSMKVCARPHL